MLDANTTEKETLDQQALAPLPSTELKEGIEDSKQVSSIIDSISGKVSDVLDNSFVKKGVFRVLDRVDEHHMETIRKLWAKTPDSVKWATVNAGFMFGAFPHIKMMQMLVRCGLLEYEEKKVHRIADVEKDVLKWTARIGPFILPELAFLSPLVKPISMIIDQQEKFLVEMRQHLRDKKNKNPKLQSKAA